MGIGMSPAFLAMFCLLINFSNAIFDCRTYEGVHTVPVKIQLPSGPLIESSPGLKPGTIVAGERVCIPGLRRFQHLKKYAHSHRVSVQYSGGVSKIVPKIELCIHRNASLGLAQCAQHEWKALGKGLWTGVISPYETKFIDFRMPDNTLFGSLTISVEEVFQQYRLMFLGLGLVMLILAPFVSKWVPFYYSSAMAFGIIAVILFLLFQGMKMLPTGRKSTLYTLFCGSVVGLGSIILNYCAGLFHSVLQELGFGEEWFNPVAVFVLLFIVFVGAWVGYWGVRKLVLSEDGSVDKGTAVFVAWAIRIVAAVMILQSSYDSLLATLMLIVGAICTTALRYIRPTFWHARKRSKQNSSSWAKNSYLNNARAQFLSRLPSRDARLLEAQGTGLKWSPYNAHMASSSLASPMNTPSPVSYMPGSSFATPIKTPSPYSRIDKQDYYSTFHKTSGRKHFSDEEWETFTKESTRKALRELVTTPEFGDWALHNADRIKISPADESEDTDQSDNEYEVGIHQEHTGGGRGWF
uniref:Uncharacterized protein n=1 Tax=Araucaria cunninghamii TaxID=56994 RepID=A0A0D6QWS9_ARACU